MNARRHSRFLRADAAVVAVVAVVIAVFALVRPGRSLHDPPAGIAGAATVTVDQSATGVAIPAGFVGLSLEYPAVPAYAGNDPRSLDPVFEQLIRNLAPGQAPVLRIGGDTADRTWWPTARVRRPAGVTYAITRRWLKVTRALAQTLGAHLILGLDLEADSPELASAEATALIRGIGPRSIRALELGNEPDLYAAFPWYRTARGGVLGRPAGYDETSFVRDFAQFTASLPRIALAGPSLSGRSWTQGLGQFLGAEPQLGLVTLHRYPLQVCLTPQSSPRYPTLDRLLSPANSVGLADSFASYVALARSHGLALRVDELNTVSCGAAPAVSKSFASALWALNTLFGLASVGVSGVNVHTFPGAGYELFEITQSGGRWQAAVSPEYYGLLMFAQATPSGSHLENVSPTGVSGVNVWATRAPDGSVRVVLTNEGGGPREVAVRVPGAFKRAMLDRLTAPSASATGGVTLGGQSFGAQTGTGVLAGPSQRDPVSGRNGRYAVALPATSAAMLVLSPR